jgi:hypothetical protein
VAQGPTNARSAAGVLEGVVTRVPGSAGMIGHQQAGDLAAFPFAGIVQAVENGVPCFVLTEARRGPGTAPVLWTPSVLSYESIDLVLRFPGRRGRLLRT